ncbi:MAG TPA: hypothetical protein VFU94_00690 [Conexibacter sp.]|nr:hypothetical protein [Conexibacter sp.]
MTTRRVVTAVAAVFIAFFAFLTFYDIVRNGVDVLAVASLVVLVLFAVGILGALATGPDDRE